MRSGPYTGKVSTLADCPECPPTPRTTRRSSPSRSPLQLAAENHAFDDADFDGATSEEDVVEVGSENSEAAAEKKKEDVGCELRRRDVDFSVSATFGREPPDAAHDPKWIQLARRDLQIGFVLSTPKSKSEFGLKSKKNLTSRSREPDVETKTHRRPTLRRHSQLLSESTRSTWKSSPRSRSSCRLL